MDSLLEAFLESIEVSEELGNVLCELKEIVLVYNKFYLPSGLIDLDLRFI